MRLLLVSTYELGHQPLHVASPAAALRAAGHEVATLDIAVEDWAPDLVSWADAVAFSVPMHTAMRLAIKGAEEIKRERPELPVCFYGLYATVKGPADAAVAGEYEPDLVAWAASLERSGHDNGVASSERIALARQRFRLPVRDTLPALDRYAQLEIGSVRKLAGYVEASHGCVHRCRHCPVPVVYDGRTRRVDVDVVLADVAQQVEAGAEHITFGDPDFLNRWAHGMKIVEQLHRDLPGITFDVTTKVSHLLRYESLIPLLAEYGCLFVVSAFESVNDDILERLDKGHTAADAARVVELVRGHGIEIRPSWLPFTPWTTASDVADLLDFVARHDLVGNVDPVQYTIRLLVPEGSLMLDVMDVGPYDADTLSYMWSSPTDDLQRELAAIVEEGTERGLPASRLFCDVRRVVYAAAGRPAPPDDVESVGDRPRLTEPWFCCAEPTAGQFAYMERSR
jgi:radical SAM superfamily enzyme YgiQ (UPF0313 family)